MDPIGNILNCRKRLAIRSKYFSSFIISVKLQFVKDGKVIVTECYIKLESELLG
jgi:hypothetical protein